MNFDAVKNLQEECNAQFIQLTIIQEQIKTKLSNYADGKVLKGNEIVGWLGEIYGKLLFDGKLVDDSCEFDFVSGIGRISVKTRKGTSSGWRRSSAIPKIGMTPNSPTHLLFVHLNDDYSIDKMWLFKWSELIKHNRFKEHKVRKEHRSYIFTLNETIDKEYIIFPPKNKSFEKLK